MAAIYAAVLRKLWGILLLILLVGCAVNRTSEIYFIAQSTLHSFLNILIGFIARILSCRLFVNLGKLTFLAYLVHVTVIRALHGWTREPYFLSFAQIVSLNLPNSP